MGESKFVFFVFVFRFRRHVLRLSVYVLTFRRLGFTSLRFAVSPLRFRRHVFFVFRLSVILKIKETGGVYVYLIYTILKGDIIFILGHELLIHEAMNYFFIQKHRNNAGKLKYISYLRI